MSNQIILRYNENFILIAKFSVNLDLICITCKSINKKIIYRKCKKSLRNFIGFMMCY